MDTTLAAQCLAITVAHDALHHGQLTFEAFQTSEVLQRLARLYQQRILSQSFTYDTLLGTNARSLALLGQLAILLSSDQHHVRWGLLSDLTGPHGASLNGHCLVIADSHQSITWPSNLPMGTRCSGIIYPTIGPDSPWPSTALFDIDALEDRYPQSILKPLKSVAY